ncbi:hypothetical protein KAX02_03540 [candidate division WOR-3 bacterium]|nr:hypothetical protein [candidate division WOR-3 bacterium]
MGKGKGAIRKRKHWRDQAFDKLGTRSMTDIAKGDRSDALRAVLGKPKIGKSL